MKSNMNNRADASTAINKTKPSDLQNIRSGQNADKDSVKFNQSSDKNRSAQNSSDQGSGVGRTAGSVGTKY